MSEMSVRLWLRYPATKLLLLLLAFLTVQASILLRQNRSLLSNRKAADSLEVGQRVAEVEGVDSESKARKVDFSAIDRIVFIYSSTCPACSNNFDNWKKIQSQVGEENILYLSLDPISEASRSYATQKGVAERMLYLNDPNQKSKLKTFRIPQTIYLSKGEVKAIHIGVLPPEKIEYFRSLRSGKEVSKM